MTNGEEDFLILRKANPAFLGDQFAINPHSKLSVVSFNQADFDPELAFEKVRHTGGSWTVGRSDDAISYGHRFHESSLQLDLGAYILPDPPVPHAIPTRSC